MKVLVTGSSGHLASFLVPALEEAGIEVEGYDLKEGKDILDEKSFLQSLEGKDAVVHLAAIPAWAAVQRRRDLVTVRVSS